MIFHDFTVLAGAIRTQRVYNTDELAANAVDVCRKMLKRLRRGEEFAEHGVAGLPAFGVGLGAPKWLTDSCGESIEAPGRFFHIAYDDMPPYLVNLVLPLGADTERDCRACATLLGLSLAATPELQRTTIDVDDQVHTFMAARPLLAAAFLPIPGLDPEIVSIAADFSTCFAAAMLLEEE